MMKFVFADVTEKLMLQKRRLHRRRKSITDRIFFAKNVRVDAVVSTFRIKCCLFNCRRTRLCLPIILK